MEKTLTLHKTDNVMKMPQNIKEELYKIIAKVEDTRILEAVYTILERELEKETDLDLSEEHKRILDERIASHKANPTTGDDWETVKERIRKKL